MADVFEYTTGDTSPPLTGTCTSNGVATPITGGTLELHIRKPSGTILTRTSATRVTMVSGAGGTWSYAWADGEIDEAGRWKVEMQVTFSDGSKETFGPASFPVRTQIA